MKRILLIGATGQLGTKIYEKFNAHKNYIIRLFIRHDSQYEHLKVGDPEIVFGDLKDKASIEKALEGCDIVITTANSAAPRKKEDSFQKVDIDGYKNLIDLAVAKGVQKFIYTSTMPTSKRNEKWIPLCRSKAIIEKYLTESRLNYSIFRSDSFMDVYFTFLGTSIPVIGEPAALVNRPFKFMQNFYNGIKDNIEKGKFGIVGDGTTKHSYIAIENVAEFMIAALDNPDLNNQTVELGGPEALSALEVKAIFEKVLEKPLKVKKTPATMMKVMGNVFSLFNEGASNILKLNYLGATESSIIDSSEWAKKLGIHLISAEQYLRAKLETEALVEGDLV
jgi:nucleoside-diphosphate-sugar epimerase